MRKLLLGVTGLGCLLTSAPSGAVTLPGRIQGSDRALTLVDGGCGGPEMYRAANGYCYRKPYAYGPRPYAYAPPPPVYYRRACVPGFHPTPWGCRPNW